jgi:hypothetical protein
MAARRQIDAAIAHMKEMELECAISLAAAAEATLPETTEPHILGYLKQHAAYKEKRINFNETINWLKHHIPPDEKVIFEQEVAFVIVRAMSKFAAVYNDGPVEWDEFLTWCVERRFWPKPPSMQDK